MRPYKSRYDRGVSCGCCGRKLDPGDSYSVRPGKEKIICVECDRDFLIDGQIEEKKQIIEMEE